jgi:hypothetical protein
VKKVAVEEKPEVTRESMAVQAEVDPCYQKVDTGMGMIGELNLTFNSPMRTIVEPVREARVKPPQRAICFVDETDLDENDEIIARCQVMRTVPSVSTEVPTDVAEEESQVRILPRPPLRAVNPVVNQTATEKPIPQETPLKARFASYSKYNWS